MTGSHVGTGRARSAGVSNASASIVGVEGELNVQRAFFDAFLAASACGRRSFSDADAATAAGFWTITTPVDSLVDTVVNPVSLRSDDNLSEIVDRFVKCKVPEGESPWNS